MARETFHDYTVSDPVTQETMRHVREVIAQTDDLLEDVLPDGRSKSLAVTHLEDCLLRAMQALALAYGDKQPLEGC